MVATATINLDEEYLESLMQGEPVIDASHKFVLLPMQSYEEFQRWQKEKNNDEYMESLNRSIQQLKEGKVVKKTMEELLAMEND